ncbi:MAG: hypothetical protein GDA56_31980 [Hormoscilla sp. GM7CHS1pb]|nr:hypothetical protein [Hormoscilla sp. GM7CHS1pb]
MSVIFNKKQLIITGLVGFATAFTIAYAVGQARDPVTTNPGSNLVPTATSSEWRSPNPLRPPPYK